MWSASSAVASLLSFTAHWLTESFQRKSAVLNVLPLDDSHTGEYLAKKYKEILATWKIKQDQVHLVLRDNAANMVKAMRDAALPSFGCFAHSLQLVVEDGVLAQRAVLDLLALCRKIVGHFKHSTTAYSRLREIQERLDLPKHRLQQDVKTRWNSSLYMVQSILEQKVALAAYATENDLAVLTPYQLDLAGKVVAALQPIEEITKAISADSTSIAVVIPLIRMLTKTLEKHHNDAGIRTMKKEMFKSLQKRFKNIENNEHAVIATFVDPRFKNKFFTGSSERVNANLLVQEKLKKVQSEDFVNGATSSEASEPPSKRPRTEIWEAFTEIIVESGSSLMADNDENYEIERYLSEPLIDFHTSNCYTWWNENSKRYPCLSKLAQGYLSAPPTSVPSERLFSGASIIYDDKRNRLAPERAETLLLIKNNFQHYFNFVNK